MSTTPMTADRWLVVQRAEGVDVREYRSWRTHGRDSNTGRTFGPVNGITIHHTAGRDSLALCYNGLSGLPGPLCHTHLSKTGVANMLSVRRANHAGTFAQNAHNAVLNESAVHPRPDAAEPVDGNDHYYGIEIENLGNGTDPYPWKQYVAAVKWATAICRHHGWSHNSVIGHKEGTRRKIDPKGPVQGPNGVFEFTMDRFRADVGRALALPAGVWPSTAPQPPEEEDDMALSAEDKAWIKDAIKEAVWGDGNVPAARPPHNNADYDTNKDWGLPYTLQTGVEGQRAALAALARMPLSLWAYKGTGEDRDAYDHLRNTEALVLDVQSKVSGLSTGGVDLDALARRVADLLSQRLAD